MFEKYDVFSDINWLQASDTIWILVNIGAGNGFLPDGIKPWHELMLSHI